MFSGRICGISRPLPSFGILCLISSLVFGSHCGIEGSFGSFMVLILGHGFGIGSSVLLVTEVGSPSWWCLFIVVQLRNTSVLLSVGVGLALLRRVASCL